MELPIVFSLWCLIKKPAPEIRNGLLDMKIEVYFSLILASVCDLAALPADDPK